MRVLYCYPERITEELLDVLAEEPHMVPYLDLPIQHCDEEILRRMHRPGNEETLRNLITHIRERVPEITLRTTLITGFPGETKEQFNRLGDFVQDMQFDHLGCFAYSEEEGTKAAAMELRGKIAAGLNRCIAQNPENKHLQRQMQRLFLTQISTVHGFCSTILRERTVVASRWAKVVAGAGSVRSSAGT